MPKAHDSGTPASVHLSAQEELVMVKENRAHLSREVKRMRDALYAIAPLAEVPGTSAVVREKLLGNVRKGLDLEGGTPVASPKGRHGG